MLTRSPQGLGFRMDEIGVVILAGGLGTRMGGGKPERLFKGRRLIEYVLDRAATWDVPMAICVREPGQVAAGVVDQIFDRPGVEGPLAGLLTALDWGRGAGLGHVLILPCDTPFLPENVLARLWRAARDAGAPAVAESNDRRHPTCAVWPVMSLPQIKTYAATGQRSLSGALDACNAVELSWSDNASDGFININTPGDLEALQG